LEEGGDEEGVVNRCQGAHVFASNLNSSDVQRKKERTWGTFVRWCLREGKDFVVLIVFIKLSEEKKVKVCGPNQAVGRRRDPAGGRPNCRHKGGGGDQGSLSSSMEGDSFITWGEAPRRRKKERDGLRIGLKGRT